MRKNKKATIISLEVLIGVVVSIIIIVSAVTIISNFFRLSDASKDSFNQLVALIEEVNQNDHATRKSMPLRMDKGTAIIGFPKNHKNLEYEGTGYLMPYQGAYIHLPDEFLNQLTNYFNEKDKSIVCLCREFETKELTKGTFKCKDGSLICKTFDELEFHDFFIFSKETEPGVLFTKDDISQFKITYVEKYGEYGENSVAVCGEGEEDSCVSQEYREEKKAIHSLNNFKNFIESCKDREFVDIENPEPCSCGAFDFKSEIPEKYIVEFTESDEKKLKLILKHEDKEDETIKSIEVDAPLCTYQPILKEIIDYLPKDEKIILNYNLPPYYTFYYKEDIEDKRIVFVKNSDENICVLRASERGHIELYAESLDTITFKPVSNIQRNVELGHSEINITACGYSITEE